MTYVFCVFIYFVIVVCGIGAILEHAVNHNVPDDVISIRIANMVFFPIFLAIWIPRIFFVLLWIALKSNFKRN